MKSQERDEAGFVDAIRDCEHVGIPTSAFGHDSRRGHRVYAGLEAKPNLTGDGSATSGLLFVQGIAPDFTGRHVAHLDAPNTEGQPGGFVVHKAQALSARQSATESGGAVLVPIGACRYDCSCRAASRRDDTTG